MRRLTAMMVAALLASMIAGESSLAKNNNVEGVKLAQAACDASCTSKYAACVRGCNDGGGAQVGACLAGCQTGLKACAIAVMKCHSPDSGRSGN